MPTTVPNSALAKAAKTGRILLKKNGLESKLPTYWPILLLVPDHCGH